MSQDAHATAVQEIFIREIPEKRVSQACHGAHDNALATAKI